jgi:hypothetical protein
MGGTSTAPTEQVHKDVILILTKTESSAYKNSETGRSPMRQANPLRTRDIDINLIVQPAGI